MCRLPCGRDWCLIILLLGRMGSWPSGGGQDWAGPHQGACLEEAEGSESLSTACLLMVGLCYNLPAARLTLRSSSADCRPGPCWGVWKTASAWRAPSDGRPADRGRPLSLPRVRGSGRPEDRVAWRAASAGTLPQGVGLGQQPHSEASPCICPPSSHLSKRELTRVFRMLVGEGRTLPRGSNG